MQYVCATHNTLIYGQFTTIAQTNVCATSLTKKCDLMPVQFLTEEQRANYGCYLAEPTAGDLTRYFHLDDDDHQNISTKRGEHNRIGFGPVLRAQRFGATCVKLTLRLGTYA